jgi:alkylation response protein AidB-like acyl-CoA dehydrogenase
MDFRDSTEEAEFRTGLRRWLAESLPADWLDREPHVGRWDLPVTRDWSRRLHDAGYTGLTWPAEYGGQGRPPTYQAILLEEAARMATPEHVGAIGLGMAGPTIIAHGTPAQKERHLSRILSGETVFCQGFSEPSSGSDLASIRTRAVRDGDDFVVTGQKVWSSYAHIADFCILLTRSDPEAPTARALTYFILDMRSPGVTVRPLRQITGDPEFNEIFLDEVRIPVEDVVGQVGGGWGVAMTTLLHERGTLGFALTARLEVLFNRLIETARRTGASTDPRVRDEIARLYVDLEGLRYTNYRSLSALMRTGVPGPEGSVAKLHWSETNQRLTSLALDLIGPDSQLDSDGGFWSGFWQYQQLRSRGNTIEAGTSEIVRSIIAERVLGLPRSR